MRVRSSTRDCSSPWRFCSSLIARLSSLITAHSIRPVNTTALMNASSSSSDSLSGAAANGPLSSLRVYQSASAHTTAIAVVTSRWPKRNAAHTMSGTMTKVRPKERRQDQRLQRAAGSDDDRGRNRSVDAQIGERAADPHAGPKARAEDEKRRQGDSGGRPQRRCIPRRDRQQQGESGSPEIDRGKEGALRDRHPPPR